MKNYFNNLFNSSLFRHVQRLAVVCVFLSYVATVTASPGGGSTTYYAKAKVQVDASCTGLGKVYVTDKDGNTSTSTDAQESAETEEMSGSSNSFSIKIGVQEVHQDYFIKEWIKNGADRITATADTMSQTITGQESSALPTTFTAVFAKQIQPTAEKLVIHALSGSSSSMDIKVYRTDTLFSEDSSDEGKFTHSVAKKDDATWILTVTATDIAENGDSLVITLKNNKNAVNTITASFVENQKVSFVGSEYGTYRVSQSDAYSETITSESVNKSLDIADPTNFKLRFSEITPISGYRFRRFVLTPENGKPYYLYDDDENGSVISEKIESNTEIKPEFVPTSYARFIVLPDTAIHYADLEHALDKAKELGKNVVAVYQPGFVKINTNGDGNPSSITRPTDYKYAWVLPTPTSGVYTIPSEITLLVPGLSQSMLKDEANKTEIEKKIDYTYLLGASTATDYVATKPDPIPVCKLIVESGTTIKANGNISVYSCLSTSQGYTGRPTGYGQIHLEDGATIEMNSGSILHVLGYITGNPKINEATAGSKVIAHSGASVYEAFQLTDWRGGTGMAGGSVVNFRYFLGGILAIGATNNTLIENPYNVFPVGQYYVQSIETLLEMEPGSREWLTTAVDVSGPFPITSEFVNKMTDGEDLGLFALGTNTIMQKYYDPVTDRLKMNLIGLDKSAKAKLSYMFLKVEVDVTFGVADISLDSRNYVLPVNNNIDILIDNLQLNVPYKNAFMAGSTMKVTTSAKLNIQNELYLYDKELNVQPGDPTKGYYGSGDWPLKPITYTAYHNKAPNIRTVNFNANDTALQTRYPEKLLDASFIIDGTMTMEGNGALYTTTYDSAVTGVTDTSEDALARDFGANITSTGSGVMNFNSLGTKTTTNQISQTVSDIKWITDIPVCNAWLRNADGTRSGGTNAKRGETYMYIDGTWVVPDADLGTPQGNEFNITLPQDTTQNVVCDVVVNGVTIKGITKKSATGQQFEVGNLTYKDGAITIPVKYKYTRVHNVGAPNEGKIVVEIDYHDPLAGDKTKDVEIVLKGTENYKPAFSAAYVNASGDTISIADGGTFTMSGYVNLPSQSSIFLVPTEKNVAKTLGEAGWKANVDAPFTFAYGTEILLSDAKITYTPTSADTHAGTLALTAIYIDAASNSVENTFTINLSGNAAKSDNTLKFKRNLTTIAGDSIFQTQTIELFENIGNSSPVEFTFEGNENNLVSIEAVEGNYRLTAHQKDDVLEPQTVVIKAQQAEDGAMLASEQLAIKLTILPPAAWNWGTLHFGATTSTTPIITQSTEDWTLSVKTDLDNLIESLEVDATYGYVATIAVPVDYTKTYTATFLFTQGGYQKEFTSTISDDSRALPYCVDNKRTYDMVTSEINPIASVAFADGEISFESTTTTAQWTITMNGVPNQLSFKAVASNKAWHVEEYNGVYWNTIFPWDVLTIDETYTINLNPSTKQVRFTYAAGEGEVGKLKDVCITALQNVKANTNKAYIPIEKDADGNMVPTTQKVTLYSVVNKDLAISLSSNAVSVDVTTLPKKTGSYTVQELVITNNTINEELVELYVKDGNNILLTLPIRTFNFRQGLPIDLANDDAERYYYLTTGSTSDEWSKLNANVRWKASEKAIEFYNPNQLSETRSVVLAYEGAADYIQFHTSTTTSLEEWTFMESADGLGWTAAVDTLKTKINDGKGIKQELKYTTRYVRVIYNGFSLSKQMLTNLKIEGTPHLLVNPESIHLNNDSEDTKRAIFEMTAINLQQIRVESSNPNNFKLLYNAENLDDKVTVYTATADMYPNALGINKVGTIQLGVEWSAINTIDEGKLIIYNDNNDGDNTNDPAVATISLLGTQGVITLEKASSTGLYTGIPDGYTYHGKPYTDYEYHEIDLTNAYAVDGTALFDYLFIFGPTTTQEGTGTDIKAPEGKTLVGSNASTPYYIYKKVTNTDRHVAYQYVGSAEANTANKASIADVIVKDSVTTYINVDDDTLSVYITGFAPYATTGYTMNEEGVFLFRGKHGAKLGIYLEDCHIFSRNKTANGNSFYGDKEGGDTFSGGSAQGSGGVLVFENTDISEQLSTVSPFEVTIHTMGNNLLKSNYGCFYALFTVMKAYQISAPIHVHMQTPRHVRTSKTTLNFDDIWPVAVDADGAVSQTKRTNGYLGLKKQSNNAPSIDLGNPHTVVNFNGGQVELQNAQIVSDNYKTTLAISYRSGEYGSDDLGIRLAYGIGTDSVGGTVNFNDGTTTVEPMWVKEAYKQYYLIDLNEDSTEIKKQVGTDKNGMPIYEYQTSCLRTPKNTYVYGGSHCFMRACLHVTSKGGAPKDGPRGSLLGQYVYTLSENDVVDPNTQLATSIAFPDMFEGLRAYQTSRGYTYGTRSIMPDENNKLYFWIPGGYGNVAPEEDKMISVWKACMTEIRAGLEGMEGSVGGNTPIEVGEEVKYFLYCQLDKNIHDVIADTTVNAAGVSSYTYNAPLAVPSVAKPYFGDAEYTTLPPTYVSDSLQYQVLSDTAYTITDRVYYITTATADIWQTFTAPFDVAKIYVVETYAESELEKFGTRAEILKEQAKHNADFAAFFGVAMAVGTIDPFDQIYQSYIKWAKTKDQETGLYDGTSDYTLRSRRELVPYFGNNWRDANFYLNHNTGNWPMDSRGDFEAKWTLLPDTALADGVLLHKGETYSMLFPYCVGCESSLNNRTYWDYWSGKFLIFESTPTAQTINGSDFLNESKLNSVYSEVPADDEVVVTGNSTFSYLNPEDKDIYMYQSDAPRLNNEYFESVEFVTGDKTIYPTTAFLYGNVPTNQNGMPARSIRRTGEIIYDDDNNGTSGHIPTVGGGNDLFITTIEEGINVAVATPQHVRVLSSTGAVIYSGMIQTALDIPLPCVGVYVVSGENEVQKVLY